METSNKNNQIWKRPDLSKYFIPGVLSKDSNLRTYFARVEAGYPKDVKTNFYGKETSREDILNSWAKILENSDIDPSLMSYENDLRTKVGPMSIMKPLSERLEDIEHYYTDINIKNKEMISENIVIALDQWCNEYQKLCGLRPRNIGNTVEKMRKNTNSGAPYFTKRNRVISESEGARVGFDITTYSSGMYGNVAILGWRGQEGGLDSDSVKQRVIWMFPFAVNIAELSVYQPFIEACQKTGLVPSWIDMDAVDKRITDLFDTCNGEIIVCTDFSKFDQHFNGEMQDISRRCLNYLLTGERSSTRWNSEEYSIHDWLIDVHPIKYHIPLICSENLMATGFHGMASGSGGTNADETIAHRVLQYYAALSRGKQLNPNSQCLGDDGLLSYPGINVDDVISAYSAFGQEMNKSKQYVDNATCVYLRRWHSTKYRIEGICRGVYSTFRAIGRLTAQERFYDPGIWTPEMVALRQLSIIENCKWHPLRNQFAEWCMKGDKYRLGIDLPGFLDSLSEKVKEATDLMPDFLGYVKQQQADAKRSSMSTSINDWWIVKYLRSRS